MYKKGIIRFFSFSVSIFFNIAKIDPRINKRLEKIRMKAIPFLSNSHPPKMEDLMIEMGILKSANCLLSNRTKSD